MSAGTITTATGSAPALQANDVAATASGAVYVLSSHSTVGLINSDGTVTTKHSDTVNEYRRFGVSPDGHMFLEAYYGDGVEVVQPHGASVQSPCNTGEGPDGVAVSTSGTTYVMSSDGGTLCTIGVDGTVQKEIEPFGDEATAGLALDQSGNLWTLTFTVGTDAHGNSVINSVGLEELQTNGQLRVVATNLPLATQPSWNGSTYSGMDLVMDQVGDVFFSDGDNHIYERTTDGRYTTIAGTGQVPVKGNGNGDGGLATAAAVNAGTIALDTAGDLYFTESYGFDDADRVREIVAASPYGGAFPRRGPTTQSLASYPSSGVGPTELPAGSNPSEVCGCAQRQATGRPVDTASGTFWHTFTDMQMFGRGPALAVTRTYSSANSAQDGLFGYGWSSPWNMSLSVDGSTGDLTVNQEDGSEVAFAPSGSAYVPVQPRMLATMVANSDGTYTFTRRSRQIFRFTATGQLSTISDLNGNTTTFYYDAYGNLTTVMAASGRYYAVYTTNGRITSIGDAEGLWCYYGYDDNGNLISATDPTGAVWTYGYDTSHLLQTMLNPSQQGAASPIPLTNVYDSSGRVTSQTDFDSNKTLFDYTSIAGATKMTDPTVPVGNVTVDYYTNGMRTKTTVGYGTTSAASTSYAYDPTTEAVSSMTDPRLKVTQYWYDSAGDLLHAKDPLNRDTFNTYDSLGDLKTTKVTSTTDPAGVTTTNVYDATGNLRSTSTPLMAADGVTVLATRTTQYGYTDPANPGLPTTVTDPNNGVTTIAYNSYGDLVSSTAPATPAFPAGSTTTHSYELNTGWMLSTVAPRGNLVGANPATYTTLYDYDYDGRLKRTREPLWSSASPLLHATSSNYYPDGNVHISTDGDGNVTTYAYDGDDQLVQTTRPDNTLIKQKFTPDSQLWTYTDAANHATTYTYDPRGNVATVTDPLGRITTYTHDLNDNLTLTAAPGATCTGAPTRGCTSRTYDDANQLTAVTYLDGKTPSITGIQYDAHGRRTQDTDATGTSHWTWDSLGRLTRIVDGNNATTNYGYDLDGNNTSIGYPDNRTVVRHFDAQNNLTAVDDGSGNTTTIGYNADGAPTTTTLPAGTGETDTTSYDPDGQISGITDIQTPSGGSPTALASFGYTRDGADQLASSTTTGISEPNQTYGYNSLNQLNASGSAATPTPYAYDTGDDITKLGQTATTASTMTYNADNQPCWSTTATVTGPTCGTVPTGATTYSYDTSGNRTGTITPSGAASYGYDEANQLTSVNSGDYYVPLTPARIAVTSTGSCGPIACTTLGPGATLNVQVAGQGGVPTTGAAAVVLNVTEQTATTAAFITVYPTGATRPATSTLGAEVGGSSANNQTTVGLGTGGQISVYNSSGNTDIIVDVEGYYPASGSGFVPITPVRVTDTRTGSGSPNAGNHLSNGVTINVPVASTNNIPATATGAVVDITTTNATGTGYITAYPSGATRPPTSSIDYNTATITKEVSVRLGTSPAGAFTVYDAGGSPALNVIVDVVGYYVADTTDTFNAVTPTRIADTRTSSGQNYHDQHIAPGGSLTIQVTGTPGVPAGATAAVVNLTVPTTSTANTYLVAYPTGAARPLATSVSYSGITAFNETTVKLSSTGAMTIWNYLGNADVIVDLLGYYTNATDTYSYNADGLRLTKTNPTTATTTHYAWNPTGTVPLLLNDGTNDYIYGPNNQPLEQITSTGAVTWLHQDQAGNTRLLTNSSGTTVGTYTYSPYGQTTAHTGTATTPLQYGQGYTDVETGFIYLDHRYYDPSTGGFVSVDPALGSTRAPYAYVADDPLEGTDPLGLSWWNPTTWTKKTWETIGVVAGSAALAATGVGLLADGAIASTATGVALAGSAVATATDGVPCIHGENRGITCTGAALGVLSLGYAGVGAVADASTFAGSDTVGTAFGMQAAFIGAAATFVDGVGWVQDLSGGGPGC